MKLMQTARSARLSCPAAIFSLALGSGVHRPERFSDSNRGWINRDEFSPNVLDEHGIGIGVLSIRTELHALPWHDSAFTRNIGRRQRGPNHLAVRRLGPI